ncbi:MAG: VanZ family protein [Faecousia sp.]
MRKYIAAAAFWLYLAVLLRITMFRSGWYQHDFCSGSIELIPFRTIFTYLSAGQWRYFLYLFGGNIFWFLPFGFYGAARERGFAVTILLSSLLSLTIEILQFVLGSGCTETEDILLNTLGGALGWLVFRGIKRLRKKKASFAEKIV